MSISKLHAFLDTSVTRPTILLTHTPTLVSDSKGFLSKQQDTENNMIYWCESGVRARQLVTTIENRILDATYTHKQIVFYIWAGTCDLSRKEGKFIYLRAEDNSAIEQIISQYDEAIKISHQYGHTIKFIEIPNFSLQLYNQFKGHPDSLSFKNDDSKLDEQIRLLNIKIQELNISNNQSTIKFNCDLIKRRKDKNRRIQVRYSYNFSNLYDGLHSNSLLSKVWLRKLYLDTDKSCRQYSESDIVELHVPQSEMDELL